MPEGNLTPKQVREALGLSPDTRQAWYDPRYIGHAGQLYIDRDDRFVLLVTTSTAGLRLSVRLRVQDPGGDVRIMNFFVDPVADGAVHFHSFDLMEGYLLGGIVSLLSGTAAFGDVYVSMALGRGSGADLQTTQALVTGYVSNLKGIGFPSQGDPSVYGPGHPMVITVPNPAAGAELVQVVPVGRRWQVLVARFTFTADANVAVRRVHLRGLDPTPTLFSDIASQDTQAAGTVLTYEYSNMGIGHATQDGINYEPLWEDVLLDPGWRLDTLTTNIQVGDQFSAITLYVREWVAS